MQKIKIILAVVLTSMVIFYSVDSSANIYRCKGKIFCGYTNEIEHI